MSDPRSCCHASLWKAKGMCTFREIFLPHLHWQGCQDAYKENHCAIPNWCNTKRNVDKSWLEKGRILIISHYLGMPRQQPVQNPGIFSAIFHLWDAVRWKQRDQPRFQIHSSLQLMFRVPRSDVGPSHFTERGLVPANPKRSWAEVETDLWWLVQNGNSQNCSQNVWGFSL